ncbi:MAG: flippase [bacterium]
MMQTTERFTVVKNVFFYIITCGLRLLSSTLLFICMARILGVEDFGKFTFALSFIGIFLVFVDYGFNVRIIKEVAVFSKNALGISSDILISKVILSVISTFVLCIVLEVMNHPAEIKIVVFVLWVAVILYSFGLYFNAIFRGLNQFQYETYPTVLFNGIQFFLILILLLLNFKVVAVAFAYLIARIIYFFVSLFLVYKKFGKLSLRFDFSRGIKVVKDSFPFGSQVILTTLYLQLDTVLLSYFKGNTEVGYYQAGMRIVVATMVIYDVIVSSYFPVISKRIKIDWKGFKKNGLALNKYMFLIGGTIATFFLLFSDIAIRLIYGEQYLHSIFIMQLLSGVIFLRFVGAAYPDIITAADNQKLRAIGAAGAVVVNVIFNLILIPIYGAIGAAIANIITHIVLNTIYVFFVIKLIKDIFIDSDYVKGLIILALIVGICLFLKQIAPLFSIFTFWVSSLLMVIVTLTNEEKQTIRYILKKGIWDRRVESGE